MDQRGPNEMQMPLQPDDIQSQRQVYRFSAEEIRVMKECNHEATFYRSIPLASISVVATYWATVRGHLTSSVKYGIVPKISFAAIFGYVIGKLSYQHVCAKKLMDIPNSRLGEHVRKLKEGHSSNATFTGPSIEDNVNNASMAYSSTDVFTKIPDQPIFDDHKPDERDRVEGLDEYDRVTDSLSEYREDSKETPMSPTVPTYDDRRRRNREEFNHRQFNDRMKRVFHQVDQLQDDANATGFKDTTTPLPNSPTPPGRTKVNKYGDVVNDH